MHPRSNRWVPLLVILMLSVPTMVGALAMAPSGADRSAGDRATAIDGKHQDEFDIPQNLTLFGNATVEDGALTLSRAIWSDAFERFILSPWTAAEGFPRISGGVLLTEAAESGNSTAQRAMDAHEMEILFDVRPTRMSGGGPIISLRGPGMPAYYFKYSNASKEIEIGYVQDNIEHSLGSSEVTLMPGDWVAGRIEIKQNEVSLSMGPAMVVAPHTFSGNFTRLQLISRPTESNGWDNVTLNRRHAAGSATSAVVSLPPDTYWDTITVSTTVPSGGWMTVSLLNASDNSPLPGLGNITQPLVTLSKTTDPWYMNPLTIKGVRLQVEMGCLGTAEPKVFMWKIAWLGDAPTFIKPIPETTLMEDQPRQNAVDLRTHFKDKFTPSEGLTYSVSYTSDNTHVRPVVNGYNLSFELPTRNWAGSESYKVKASDGVLSVESLLAKVVVKPVDDPPVISPLPPLTVKEDKATLFNLTPYLADVDTPMQFLRVRSNSDYITVAGQVLTILYATGGLNETVQMEVSDATNTVPFVLDITVVEVDDPPVLSPIKKVSINEDEERRIPLATLIYDEDTPANELVLSIPDRDYNIRLDGTTIVLLYTVGGGQFNYTVQLSDGTSNVSQKLLVSVLALNDPPVIVSVGDLTPEDGEVSYEMEEGNESQLKIDVEDEESTTFRFSLISDFDGASLSYDTLNIKTKVGELGTYRLVVTAADNDVSTVVIIHLSVVNRNDPPVDLAIVRPENGLTVTEGEEVSFHAYAADPDEIYGDVLSYVWSSDLDGVLSRSRSFTATNLSVGTHTITVEVSDGKLSNSTSVSIIVKAKDGGGGNGGGGGGGGGDGGVTSGGTSTYIMVGVVAAIVVVGGLLFVMRSRGRAVPGAGETESGPKRKAAPKPSAKAAPKAGPEVSEGAAPPSPTADEAAPPVADAAEASIHVDGVEASPEFSLDYEVAKEPVQEEMAISYEAVALDTTLLAESDPEQLKLDGLKRKYQGAISMLDFGVPAKELRGMDWYELAAAMAKGEHMVLDDGREVTKIGDHWYYSDVNNLKTFLRRHD